MRAVAAAALVVWLLAPASAALAQGDPACAPDKALVPTFFATEGGKRAPLVATHELTVVGEWSDEVRNAVLSVPDGVRVLGTRPRRISLIAPVSASLAVTATWQQARDPLDPDTSASDPATRCVATYTAALPVTATRPSRAVYDLGVNEADAFTNFAVLPDRTAGDKSPLAVSVRVVPATRFPSPRSRARTMTVAMRPSERVKYRRRIPQGELLATPDRCRFYSLICDRRTRVYVDVRSLGAGALSPRTPKRRLMAGALMSRLQPFRTVAPYGITVGAVVFSQPGHEPPALGFDIQVRQSGELVARVRRAARCRKEPNGFGERFYRCRVVRRENG